MELSTTHVNNADQPEVNTPSGELFGICRTKAPRCSKDAFEEQLSRFQVFPALAGGLNPKSSLGFWLVSGITQYDPFWSSVGSDLTQTKCRHKCTDTQTRACMHTRAHEQSTCTHLNMHTLPANDGVRIHTQLPPILVPGSWPQPICPVRESHMTS